MRRRHRRFRQVNAKRVRRVMKTAGIQAKRPRRTTNSAHGFQRYLNPVHGLTVTRPDQVWVCDIAAVRLAGGAEVYLAIVLDVFTRAIRG